MPVRMPVSMRPPVSSGTGPKPGAGAFSNGPAPHSGSPGTGSPTTHPATHPAGMAAVTGSPAVTGNGPVGAVPVHVHPDVPAVRTAGDPATGGTAAAASAAPGAEHWPAPDWSDPESAGVRQVGIGARAPAAPSSRPTFPWWTGLVIAAACVPVGLAGVMLLRGGEPAPTRDGTEATRLAALIEEVGALRRELREQVSQTAELSGRLAALTERGPAPGGPPSPGDGHGREHPSGNTGKAGRTGSASGPAGKATAPAKIDPVTKPPAGTSDPGPVGDPKPVKPAVPDTKVAVVPVPDPTKAAKTGTGHPGKSADPGFAMGDAGTPGTRKAAERLLSGLGDPLSGFADAGAAATAYRDLVLYEARGDALPEGVHLLMARTAALLRRPAEALASAMRAIELLPAARAAERSLARRIAAEAAFRLSRHDLAERWSAEAGTSDPDWIDGRRIRVRSLIALGKVVEAETHARALQRERPEHGTELAWAQLAQSDRERAAGRPDRATDLAGAAASTLLRVPTDREDDDRDIAIAIAMLRTGKPDAAAEAARRAAKTAPGRAVPAFLLGQAMTVLGKADEADRAFATAGELAIRSAAGTGTTAGPAPSPEPPLPVMPADWPADPKRQAAQCAVFRGRLRLAAGDLDKAESRFREGYLLRGDFTPAFIGLAEVHLARGRHAEALETLDEAVGADPRAARAHLLRAVVIAAASGGRPQDDAPVYDALRTALQLDKSLRAEAAGTPALKPLLGEGRYAKLLEEAR